MKITIAQIAPKLSRSNLKRVVDIVKEYKKESDLIIFPELSLSGYLLQDKLYEDAWSLDEIEELIEASKDIDIVVGAAMRDKKVFRNSALYLSKGALLSRHDKVHLPNYGMFEEARYFSAGNVFESFYVGELKVSMLVCEDLWNAQMHADLYKEDPDLIIVIAASPARGFEESGLLIEKQWYSLINAAALNSKSKVIFVNRVGFEDGLGFWGGSCIVDERTNILAKLPKYDECIESFEIEGLS
ncbi:Glutamine amidotransferase chain of NAD synthetase [hydrothermal vent metagenome]|uniref:Glutamine amidotransferase chain of NAD synthetase n=1 Tax=hydrothermal vent metagenome TaxID=652676 RepID=A0A1W1BT03_9ZZZZ